VTRREAAETVRAVPWPRVEARMTGVDGKYLLRGPPAQGSGCHVRVVAGQGEGAGVSVRADACRRSSMDCWKRRGNMNTNPATRKRAEQALCEAYNRQPAPAAGEAWRRP